MKPTLDQHYTIAGKKFTVEKSADQCTYVLCDGKRLYYEYEEDPSSDEQFNSLCDLIQAISEVCK